MKQELFYRTATFDASSIDVEGRRCTLAFSSEQPYQRAFGVEVLSHRAEDVDMSFMSSGSAPLLVEHDEKNLVGVVESAQIEGGTVGRAVVRFSKSAAAESIWQDVVDGVRKNVSVGYAITDKKHEKNGNQTVVRCAWRPMEISLVSVPADRSVGVGRSASSVDADEEEKQGDITMTTENKKDEVVETRNAEVQSTKAFDIEVVRSEAQKQERARVADISELATQHGVQELGNEFIRSGKDVNDFRSAVLEQLSKRQTVSTHAPIGLTEKEVKQFSLARAVTALVSGDYSQAGFEMEVSKAVAKQVGKIATRNSFFIPSEYGTRAAGANAVTAANNSALVEQTQGTFMDVLFNQTIAGRLGVTPITGLTGSFNIPKFTNAATARNVNEGVDGTIDKVDSDEIVMSPKSIIAAVELTRTMMNSTGNIENWLRAQLIKAVTQRMDQNVFAAVLADTDINWLTHPSEDSGIFDYRALRAAVTKLAVQNSLVDGCKWAMDPTVADYFATTEKDSNTVGIYLLNEDGKMAGYGSEMSNNVGDNLIFGDWSQVIMGSWSTLELSLDTSQKFLSGGFLLRAITDMDVAVGRPESITGYKDVIGE